jgi:AraC-like DNA-binding protein
LPVSALVAANMVRLYLDVGDQYGIARQELLAEAGLDSSELLDPNAFIPRSASDALLRALARRSGDPAIGFRIARAFDLRTMGFWGYALMSSLTMRQRIQLHLRYNKLHNPTGLVSFRVEGERAIVEMSLPEMPPDLLPIFVDVGFAITCRQMAKQLQSPRPEVELWLTYPEQPHHQELRALVTGPVVFEAPHFRIAFAAKELERRLLGDPHLLELAKAQLELQLSKVTQVLNGDLLTEVRARLATRLSRDASLESVAADLRVSARTLRRRLSALGASFQGMLDEVRRARAVSYLVETDQAIERVAEYLGYRDPANFRRAFRRWTGAAPADFRRQHRSAGRAVKASEPPAP